MAKAECIFPREQGAVRPDQLLPHERGQLWREPCVVGHQRLYDRVVKHFAFDGAALEDRPLGRVQLVKARREQRLERRRHVDLAVPRLHHRRHLLDEQRVAASRREDPLAHVIVELVAVDPRVHQRRRLL